MQATQGAPHFQQASMSGSLDRREFADGVQPRGAKDANMCALAQFDPAAVTIPAVDSSTARFMGVPLVPPFRIAVQPTKLQARPNVLAAARASRIPRNRI